MRTKPELEKLIPFSRDGTFWRCLTKNNAVTPFLTKGKLNVTFLDLPKVFVGLVKPMFCWVETEHLHLGLNTD